MLLPAVQVRLSWRSAVTLDDSLKDRLTNEVEQISWTLSQMEALVDEAHRLTGMEHAYLLPRLELRLPLYDVGKRYRLSLSYVEKRRITLLDDQGRAVADVTLH